MEKYKCPVCEEEIESERLGQAVHNHYVKEIGAKFLKEGFLVIQEGKAPSIPEAWDYQRFYRIKVAYQTRNWKKVIREWKEPDLIILKDNKLTKIIEVLGTAEDYRILAAKVAKISEFLKPPEIIVFDAAEYANRFLDEKRRKRLQKIIGFEPDTYKKVGPYYKELLEKEYGLKFTLWYEENIK